MNVKLTLPKGGVGQFDNFLKKGALWYIASESEHNVCLHAAQSTSIILQSISSCGNSMSAKKIMRKEYSKPPIVEKVCQFLLTPDTPWDVTIPGQIYNEVKQEFTIKEPGVLRRVRITPPRQGTPEVEKTDGVRFFTHDKKKLIQLTPRNLAINCLKPCPTWDEFKLMIEKVYDILTNVTQFERFQAIKLIYVNRIEIPISSEKKTKIENYFDFRPFLGQNLPEDMLAFVVGSLLPFNEYRDICDVNLTSLMPEKPEPEHGAFLLKLDYYPAKPNAIPVTDAVEWLEKAHENIVTTFEGCITNPLREIFKEVK
jgi:uncharacterized protein (TIGR04255 family)